MARKYVNLARSSVTVTDEKLSAARDAAASALARLSAAEHADPLAPGWDAEYTAASAASRAADRRVEALETLRAAQVERGGKRDAAVKAAAGELDAMASALGASRDQVAATAAAHLTALAGLAGAIGSHNALLARSRARSPSWG